MNRLENFSIIKIRRNHICVPKDYLKPNFKNRFILDEFNMNNQLLKNLNYKFLEIILEKTWKNGL